MTVYHVDPAAPDAAAIAEAVRWIARGGIVAVPTDTLYGLAADPTSVAAVEALVALKGRGAGAALPLVAGSMAQVERACGPLDASSARLARVFWPGPLSLIVPAPATFADGVHAGLRTVAIRVPNHAVTRALLDGWGAPLTATSANRSGDQPAARVEDLGDVANDARVLVLDSGPIAGGPASTIVDARHQPPVLVRAGAIAWSRVLESLHA